MSVNKWFLSMVFTYNEKLQNIEIVDKWILLNMLFLSAIYTYWLEYIYFWWNWFVSMHLHVVWLNDELFLLLSIGFCFLPSILWRLNCTFIISWGDLVFLLLLGNSLLRMNTECISHGKDLNAGTLFTFINLNLSPINCPISLLL